MLGSFLSTFMLNLADFLSLKAEASCKGDKAETVKLHEAALSCWPEHNQSNAAEDLKGWDYRGCSLRRSTRKGGRTNLEFTCVWLSQTMQRNVSTPAYYF